MYLPQGFSGGAYSKEPASQCRRRKRGWFDPWVGKTPWRRAWQPTPVFLSGESLGQRNLMGYSPWVAKSRTRLGQLSTKHAPSTRQFCSPNSSYRYPHLHMNYTHRVFRAARFTEARTGTNLVGCQSGEICLNQLGPICSYRVLCHS